MTRTRVEVPFRLGQPDCEQICPGMHTITCDHVFSIREDRRCSPGVCVILEAGRTQIKPAPQPTSRQAWETFGCLGTWQERKDSSLKCHLVGIGLPWTYKESHPQANACSLPTSPKKNSILFQIQPVDLDPSLLTFVLPGGGGGIRYLRNLHLPPEEFHSSGKKSLTCRNRVLQGAQ